MSKNAAFWTVLVGVSIVGTWLAIRYFSEAFPIVGLDLQMDRSVAMAAARELAQRHEWGPDGFRQAASFTVDREVQNFVELEAGGPAAFSDMIAGDLYSPFRWTVRHFKEGVTREVAIGFTPAGKPYGFAIKLPEHEAGPTLSPDSARAIAEVVAAKEWGVAFADYDLVERSQETRPGGRTDHTFVYERPDVQIGEGRYRLRLVVGGAELSELTHFVKVPEAFTRRHEEMRSANETISFASVTAMVILYVLGGIGIGLSFLLRQRWVLWRQPLFWGLFFASLSVLVELNWWPFVWMEYDTAVSAGSFLTDQIIWFVVQFLGRTVLYTLTFMAAESLTRRAFPGHIRLWQIWSSDVASSQAVLGRTLGGFLSVGVFFGFVVIFYIWTRKYLGWWIPSDTLVEPNVLATYVPWFTSIAISFHAGFWEESLFRAIPIAGAALLGERLGYRRTFIIVALIVQAVIFGGAHAGYANQPAYARVVELIIPSIAFGLIYISYGLLPAIILHFAYDVVWFALPLFVSTAPGIWVDQTFVVAFTLIPLWIVVISRVRTRRWNTIRDEHLNASWSPEVPAQIEPTAVRIPQPDSVSGKAGRLFPTAGVVGVVLWLIFTPFESDAPPLEVSRTEAIAIAEETLLARGIGLDETWHRLTSVEGRPREEHRFVWQDEGKDMYTALLGVHLTPPHWKVRFARFEGDVAERVEEYQVFIAGSGEVLRFVHQLPEARPDTVLELDAARALAHAALQEYYGLDPDELKEVSAVSARRPARMDWTFEYADTAGHPLAAGEARIAVVVAGGSVVDARRYVHVPEEWTRQERDRRTIPMAVQGFSGIFLFLLFMAGVTAAIVACSKRKFSAGTFILFLGLLLG